MNAQETKPPNEAARTWLAAFPIAVFLVVGISSRIELVKFFTTFWTVLFVAEWTYLSLKPRIRF